METKIELKIDQTELTALLRFVASIVANGQPSQPHSSAAAQTEPSDESSGLKVPEEAS